MSKNRLSIYICAAVFFILTGLKLLFPAFAAEASEALASTIDKDGSFRSAFRLVGEIISTSDESISSFFVSEKTEKPAVEDAADKTLSTVKAAPELPGAYYTLRARALEGASAPREASFPAEEAENGGGEHPEPESSGTDAAEPVDVEYVPPVDTEKEAAQSEAAQQVVAAFLESQSEFAWLELPENASYECPTLGLDYSSPISGISSSGFGYRLHPILGEVKFHYGTDFPANQGDDIAAFADGTVLIAGESDSYGNYIIISHDGGIQTLYAHCSELLVSSGEYVSRGQIIARVGSTGLATGPHLHFELKSGETYLNPEFYTYEASAL